MFNVVCFTPMHDVTLILIGLVIFHIFLSFKKDLKSKIYRFILKLALIPKIIDILKLFPYFFQLFIDFKEIFFVN